MVDGRRKQDIFQNNELQQYLVKKELQQYLVSYQLFK